MNSSKNKEFQFVTYFFLIVFVAMIGYFVYFNVFESEKVINSPYNARLNDFSEHVTRGAITDINGNVLAQSTVNADGSEGRVYPYGDMFAHIVGYSTNGKTGIEALANFNLLRSNSFIIDRIVNDYSDKKNMGDTVVTTLDKNLQMAAYNAMQGKKGAVFAMDPKTGAILACVSAPTFDPNNLTASWEWLNSPENSDANLLNRATQGLYTPGSIFKVFTTLEFIRENPDYDAYSYFCDGSISEGGIEISCYNHEAHGAVSLQDSFAMSCNSSFINIGLSLDNTAFRRLCQTMYFNSELPLELEYEKSRFDLNEDSDLGTIMMTAFGQGTTLVSPAHMAMITSAIANDGVLMKPYVVDRVESVDGGNVSTTKATSIGSLMTPEEAGILQTYMESVVDYGTGWGLNGSNYTAAGKTGTAEYSDDTSKSHSWFIGYGNTEDPDIVIAVVIEESTSGSESAVPVAKYVLDAFYNK